MISELENIDAEGLNEIAGGEPGQEPDEDDAPAEDEDEDEDEEDGQEEDPEDKDDHDVDVGKREEVLHELQAVEYTGE